MCVIRERERRGIDFMINGLKGKGIKKQRGKSKQNIKIYLRQSYL